MQNPITAFKKRVSKHDAYEGIHELAAMFIVISANAIAIALDWNVFSGLLLGIVPYLILISVLPKTTPYDPW